MVCSPDANRRISHLTSKRMPRHYSLSHLSWKQASVVLRINSCKWKASLPLRMGSSPSLSTSPNFSPWSFCCLKCVSFFCSDLLFYSFSGKRKIFELWRGSQWLRLHVRCSLSFNPQRLQRTAHCSRHSPSQNTQGRSSATFFFLLGPGNLFVSQLLSIFHHVYVCWTDPDICLRLLCLDCRLFCERGRVFIYSTAYLL